MVCWFIYVDWYFLEFIYLLHQICINNVKINGAPEISRVTWQVYSSFVDSIEIYNQYNLNSM